MFTATGPRWLASPVVAPPPPSPAPSTDVGWPTALLRGVAVSVASAIFGLVFWSVLPALVGWHAQVVLTGSMQPRIVPGDLVLAAPLRSGDLQPGRVLLFRDPAHPGRTLVHRLVRFDNEGRLITKGDANQSEDTTPVTRDAVLGLPRLRVPFVGRPVVWRREGDLRAFALVLGVGTVSTILAFGARPTRF
jgi:signal peptidase